MAKENGVAVVGVKHISHSGALGYFVEMASKANMVGLSMCQSDPMVVPFGGTEPYFGTNQLHLVRRLMMRELLHLIWRQQYKHGAKCSMLEPNINLFQILGQ